MRVLPVVALLDQVLCFRVRNSFCPCSCGATRFWEQHFFPVGMNQPCVPSSGLKSFFSIGHTKLQSISQAPLFNKVDFRTYMPYNWRRFLRVSYYRLRHSEWRLVGSYACMLWEYCSNIKLCWRRVCVRRRFTCDSL